MASQLNDLSKQKPFHPVEYGSLMIEQQKHGPLPLLGICNLQDAIWATSARSMERMFCLEAAKSG